MNVSKTADKYHDLNEDFMICSATMQNGSLSAISRKKEDIDMDEHLNSDTS